jgi:hypothetical protein
VREQVPHPYKTTGRVLGIQAAPRFLSQAFEINNVSYISCT